MKLTLLLPPKYDERKWKLAKQAGIDYAITKAIPSLSGKRPPYNFDALKNIKEQFADAGFQLHGLEGDQFDMSSIKLGLPDRDKWIERYQQMIRNMGKLEIPLLCYNFMASFGWLRTNTRVLERGGALTTEFVYEEIKDELVPEDQRISEKQLWNNLWYFLDAVLPVAEEHGVEMALHPDDPPISPLKGVGRILTSAKAFDKILQRYPSPVNGITFCQATFKTMEEDLKAISKRWLDANRIFFLHLRDVRGDKYNFRETFHDNGPSPMAELLNHYYEYGFDGPLRVDHAPTMFGENQEEFSGGISAGYEITGKVFAIGYMRGIYEMAGIPIH